jgi:putative DNA primase/helicase
LSPQDILAIYQHWGFPLLYWERTGPPDDWKGPRDKGWNDPSRLYPLDRFDPSRHNLGVFTGSEIAPGRHLADVDMDWAPGIALAKRLLPPTAFGLGRKEKKLSHALYTASEPFGIETFYDVTEDGDGNGKTLVELRMGNYSHQTMLAPSLHTPPDTCIELVQSKDIGHYELSRLRNSVVDKAIGCLVLKRVPGGLHHDGRLALAGFLLKHGFAPERVTNLLEALCEAQVHAFVSDMSGKDVADCYPLVESTRKRLAEGKKVKGGPAFAEFCGALGSAIVKRLAAWIGIGDGDALILDPTDTRRSARLFIAANYTVNDTLTLRRQAGVFYHYQPKLGAYDALADETVRAELYSFLETAKARTKDEELTDFRPNRNKVSDVLDAFNALANLDPSLKAPRWLANEPLGLNRLDILVCPNGLLHIPTRALLPPTPDFFTLNGIDCEYNADAPTPTQWLTFLDQLWSATSDEPGDPDSIDTLQEVFGYLLCPDTHFQKLFSIIGPKRSGKSLIGRVLARLGGERNTCSPTLASFGDQFGKQGLIGKTLAIIGDARISGRSDSASVAETLLGISGEDPQTVQRKNLPDWNGKLSTRFLLLANEPPKIDDISGALAARFVMLVLTRSFYGKEDLTLFDKLTPELPGILNWALVGRDRLYTRRHFVQPESGKALVEEFENLSSPVGAMLTECTEKKPGAWVSQRQLFEVWTLWCVENGRKHPGTTQTFGRDVRTARPWAKAAKRGPMGKQERGWLGLTLTREWTDRLPPVDEQPPLPEEM